MQTLGSVNLKGIPLFKRGKVRDVYDLGEKLLIISTDRISAFDYVLPTLIPLKGIILNQLSLFWFNFTSSIVENHLITSEVDDFPDFLKEYKDILKKRSMIVKKVKVMPVECVVRGYLFGSGWKEYKQTGKIGDVNLPSNLKESSKLPFPIFTPATKAESGHDENISFERVKHIIGDEISDFLKYKSIEIYDKAFSYALERGIIIADSKFEFGIDEKGNVILVDEVLTPDSSRFWALETYEGGKPQVSYDKQFVRDYLESVKWDKNSPPPDLPKEVVIKTKEKYIKAYRLLTGKMDI
ncbi:MAG: phosphoribosylaminoimidazolesuccinocarboxamide synthase [Acidobacteriota bacterium]